MDLDPARRSPGSMLPLVFLAIIACGGATAPAPPPPPPPPPPASPALYDDVSSTHLPGGLGGLIMDARAADLDMDGDLDVVLAHEFQPNILLLNDGTGRFSNASARLPSAARDSEDVGIADFDGDGDLDVVVVSEDDAINELYFNDGAANFSDEGARLPVTGISNAVLAADVNGDGSPDILIGNNGQNAILINDGSGNFTDETAARFPSRTDVTQDLELGDVDGDGDLDLLVGNEDRNRLLINSGGGVYVDESDRVPTRAGAEETREADFGDVDGDGDLDILFANVRAFLPASSEQNRLLINDGTGTFNDETSTRLPPLADRSFDGDFLDVDGDGDLDIVTTDAGPGGVARPFRVFLNDGSGVFELAAPGTVLPTSAAGAGFDIEFADFDGDGRADLYLASRGTADRLLLRR